MTTTTNTRKTQKKAPTKLPNKNPGQKKKKTENPNALANTTNFPLYLLHLTRKHPHKPGLYIGTGKPARTTEQSGTSSPVAAPNPAAASNGQGQSP